TEHLSHRYQRAFNWQTLSIDTDHRQWRTPIAYLASDQAITLTHQQKQNLKRFLDAGGTLLANADNQSREFIASIRQLARELYPRYELEPASVDHAITRSLGSVPVEHARQTLVLSNGV